MAHYAKTLSFLFLTVLFLSLKVEARESKFFSKVTPKTTTITTTKNVMELEAPQVAPAPETVSPTSTTTTAASATVDDVDNEILTEAFGANYEAEEKWDPYSNKNGNSNNNNGNRNPNSNNYYGINGYEESYKNGNSYASEKQGMSDTRFVENGKYYYNVKNENYYSGNGYESEKGSDNKEGYYNGNGENEFNTMEEYERQQGYPESQGQYIP